MPRQKFFCFLRETLGLRVLDKSIKLWHFNKEMNWQIFLRQELDHRQRENPKYSLRSFAKMTKMSPAQMSKILAGKKELSAKMALNLAEVFGLSATETLFLMKDSDFEDQEKKDGKYTLNPSELKDFCNWIVFAIMGLAEISPNQASPEWIAAKLKISRNLAEQAFNLMKDKNYIKIERGQFRRAKGYLRTESDIPSALIRRHHRVVMQLASERLEQVPIAQREYGSYMVAINKSRLPAAKKMIRKFLEEFCNEFDRGKKTDVVSLSLQMFTLTESKLNTK